jgi:hypothetical protein
MFWTLEIPFKTGFTVFDTLKVSQFPLFVITDYYSDILYFSNRNISIHQSDETALYILLYKNCIKDLCDKM